jgi:glycosyltransferase involved in cell wall biosynthesis
MNTTSSQESNDPLVSVILCVYNGEAYLRKSIDSILAQTYKNIELIIIDDKSTDSTPTILQSYSDPRIKIISNHENIGTYRSANKGLAVATGEFIARHDADDISHQDRFRCQVNFFLRHPKVGLLGTSYYVIDRDDRVIDITRPPTTNDTLQQELESGNQFHQSSVMFTRDVLRKVEAYREISPVSQDYDMWLRMAEQCEIANLPDLLVQVRFHSKSLGRTNLEFQRSCGSLARDLAKQRRYKGKEKQIPSEIMLTYPPDPQELFNAYRYYAYLYYASMQESEAVEALIKANEYLRHLDNPTPLWEDWIFSKALLLADLRKNHEEGAHLIIWFLNQVDMPEKGKTIKRLIGRFYADRAVKS